MYNLIAQYFTHKHANVLAPIIYALMILSILYFSFEKEAEFNYLVI